MNYPSFVATLMITPRRSTRRPSVRPKTTSSRSVDPNFCRADETVYKCAGTTSESSTDDTTDPDFRVGLTSRGHTSACSSVSVQKKRVRKGSSRLKQSAPVLKRLHTGKINNASEQSVPSTNVEHRQNETIQGNSALSIPHFIESTGMDDEFSDLEICQIRTSLLEWYAVHHRKFPWRAPPRYRLGASPLPVNLPEKPSSPGAPYAVWISEVMSQQTRIDVVVSYYNRWIQRFPTLEHVANASLDIIYELWAGLGYYRRAKFLHEGAKQIVEFHNGSVPADLKTLNSIRGIGRYTAGAIASIAFHQPTACVDGNVDRVLSRLRPAIGSEGNVQVRMKSVWQLAGSLVGELQVPGDFNQALMELGATICKPRNPDCKSCPVQSVCGAYALGALSEVEDITTFVMQYPAKAKASRCKVRSEAVVSVVAWHRSVGGIRMLSVKRRAKGLLEGLWEAPNEVIGSSFQNESFQSAFHKTLEVVCRVLNSSFGNNESRRNQCLDGAKDVGDVTHIFSHIRQTLRVMAIEVDTSEKDTMKTGITQHGEEFQWISPSDMDSSAMSTQMKKVFLRALDEIQQDLSCRSNNSFR